MTDVLIVVRYHVWWPAGNDPWYLFNTGENTARVNYYGVSGVPNFRIDGYINGGSNRNGWASMIENEAAIRSRLTMNIEGNYDPGRRTGQFTVTILAESDPDQSNLKLRAVLTESSIRQTSPNGLTLHEQVFRDMMPSTSGEAFSIGEGETLEFSYQFTTQAPIVADNCQLVAFVQSDQNRQVLQSASVWVRDLIPTGVDDDGEIPVDFVLEQNYPNPFNAETRIAFQTTGGAVALQIYDLTGSLVRTLVDGDLEAGYHSVVWDGKADGGSDAASGVYFYRLSTPDQNMAKRMTLIK
jgi:hypothetical protein